MALFNLFVFIVCLVLGLIAGIRGHKLRYVILIFMLAFVNLILCSVQL